MNFIKHFLYGMVAIPIVLVLAVLVFILIYGFEFLIWYEKVLLGSDKLKEVLAKSVLDFNNKINSHLWLR